ncbi:chemotaxis-related protein WspD [Roseomonas rosea]|uniref:Chemotaxis protein CheW n=1 Tax=Muricoccus roseus TaxID=198092 RepID=A0A1M6PDN3_9PROT|nr:chemotaxis protein CheW [Roseomonas rosea]SHK06034.1 chemotaxis-related protein WspD [Roseomonas rosea]
MGPGMNPGIDPCWGRVGVAGDASCPELRAHVHCRNCPTHGRAAAALLDRPPPEGYLAEWTGHVARGSALSGLSLDFARREAARAARSAMIFRIGAEWLALPTGMLQEVAEMRPVHSLPHRRDGVVLGVTNIHGALLICVSLSVLLGLEALAQGGGTGTRRLLVIGPEAGRFVFPADEVHGMHRYAPDALSPPPDTVSRAASSHVRHVLSWEGRSVGLLDGELLLASLNRRIA